jgi:tetratricopeptide (TPR) repeat protein
VELPVTNDGVVFHRAVQVTAGNESNYSPDMSQNGAYVVYTSDRAGNKDIWEKETNGGFSRQLTSHSADDFFPVLSPGGEMIAFVSRRLDAAGDIHILDLGSSTVFSDELSSKNVEQKLTEDGSPSWFPDSKKVVFAARKPGALLPQIMIADVETLVATPLGEVRGDQPTVSPSGKQVAYVVRGNIFLYDMNSEKSVPITTHKVVQDGQPRFSPDGTHLYFIRYADDTNDDGELNGDDKPIIVRVNLANQVKNPIRENFGLEVLTSADMAAYSPQERGSSLYFTVQNLDSLDVFRLPLFGHMNAPKDLADTVDQFVTRTTNHEKTYLLRRAQAGFYLAGDMDTAAEVALMELRFAVEQKRFVESRWLIDKIRANFSSKPEVIAQSKLFEIDLALSPIVYPDYEGELTNATKERLQSLSRKVAKIVEVDGKSSEKVHAFGRLIQAKILASRREFFKANEILEELSRSEDESLSGESDLYFARIIKATSHVSAAIGRFKGIAEKYSHNRVLVLRASKHAVELVLKDKETGLENLQILRTETKGLPIMPAMAHMGIADYFQSEKKPAVSANELRQVVDSYPDSPEILLLAAERLSKMEEREGRFLAAEKMLTKLQETLKSAKSDQQESARLLLIKYHLRRGAGLLRTKEYEAGLKEYEKVIAKDPLETSAHRGRINAKYALNEIQSTIDEYEDLADANPESAQHQYFYAYALTFEIDQAEGNSAKIGRIKSALDQVLKARELNSQLVHIHQTLGWLDLQLGYWKQRERDRVGAVEALLETSFLTRWLNKFDGDVFWSAMGFGDPNWLELAGDSFLTAYYLSEPGSIERADLAQNLGQTYYELKNYRKSLSYYMQRIQLLELIPAPNASLEGVIWRRAGRAAFQTDELLLAESLQRRALAVWEEANSDEGVAYSLDALALTLREQNKLAESSRFYERLLRINRRMGVPENEIGTLTNLGYTEFLLNDFDRSFDYLNKAEDMLVKLQTAREDEGEEKKEDESITVSLAGAGSAAMGFDLFARHILIVTFKARLFERNGRPDLALKEYKRKLKLLLARREKGVDDEGKGDAYLVEDISIVRNNIAQKELASGNHKEAVQSYKAAASLVKETRKSELEYMSRGEWINFVNYTRVQLRLAKLGELSDQEIIVMRDLIDKEVAAFRPVVTQGSKSEAVPLAQLLYLGAQFKQNIPNTPDEALIASLEDSIKVSETAGQEPSAKTSALLGLKEIGLNPKKIDVLKDEFTVLRKAALTDPKIEWKFHSVDGDWSKSFEALDRYLASGGVLSSPNDRQSFKSIFEKFYEGSDEQERPLLMRRYALLRSLEIANRSLGLPSTDKKLSDRLKGKLQLGETGAIQELIEDAAVINVHLGDQGDFLVYLLTAESEKVYSTKIGDDRNLTMAKVGAALQESGVLSEIPESVKQIYLIPNHELFELKWEDLPQFENQSLTFIPTVEVLSTIINGARLPKLNLAVVGKSTVALPKISGVDRKDLDGNTEDYIRDIREFDLVHFNIALRLNHINPGYSVIRGDAPQLSEAVKTDIQLHRLSRMPLFETTALIFAESDHHVIEPMGTSQGIDGWIATSLAGLGAGVSTVIQVNPMRNGTQQVSADWNQFYSAIQTKSFGQVVKAQGSSMRLFGHPGFDMSREKELIADLVEDATEEANDALDDEAWAEASELFKRVYYYSIRTGETEEISDILDALVNSNYRQSKFEQSLHYKVKMAESIKTSLDKDGEDSDYELVDYGEVTLDAAVLAVRAHKEVDAEKYLAIAEKIFEEEDDPEQLGKIYHYRGINLDNQSKYDETIAAYQKSYEIYQDADESKATQRLLDIANLYRNKKSDFSQALNYYDRASEGFLEQNNRASYLNVLIDKANTLIMLGRLDRAIAILDRKVLPAIPKDKSPFEWGRAAGILGNAYYMVGRFQDALERSEGVLEVVDLIKSKSRQTRIRLDARNLRAMVFGKLGRYKESFQIFEELLTASREAKLLGKEAEYYNNYGFFLREFGEIDRSIKYFEEAMRIDQQLKSKGAIAYDMRNLGLSVILKGDYNTARDLLIDALNTSEELKLAYNSIFCYLGLGDVALREGEYVEAEGYFGEALAVADSSTMMDFVWRAHSGIGTSQWKTGRIAEAEKSFASSLAVIESLSAGLKNEASRNSFQSDRGVQEVYQDYVTVLMAVSKVDEAWMVSEKSRSRSFIDSIATQRLDFANPESNSLLESFNEENSKVLSIERLVASASDEQKKSKLTERLKIAKSEADKVLATIENKDKALRQFVKVEAIDKDKIAELIGDETALVEYFVTPEMLHIWTSFQGKLSGTSISVTRTDLTKRVKDFRTLLQNYSTTDYLGAELADLLIYPIKANIQGAKRLAIVPHGELHFLPFSALPIEIFHWVGERSIFIKFD